MYAAGLWTFKGRPFPENDHISNWKQPRVRNHFLLSQLHCLDVRWSKLHGMNGAWSSHHHELDSFQWVYDIRVPLNGVSFPSQKIRAIKTQEAWPWHHGTMARFRPVGGHETRFSQRSEDQQLSESLSDELKTSPFMANLWYSAKRYPLVI